MIRRIRVRYRLLVDPVQAETAHRAHEVHAESCPVYRTVRGCIDVTTELGLEADEPPC